MHSSAAIDLKSLSSPSSSVSLLPGDRYARPSRKPGVACIFGAWYLASVYTQGPRKPFKETDAANFK